MLMGVLVATAGRRVAIPVILGNGAGWLGVLDLGAGRRVIIGRSAIL